MDVQIIGLWVGLAITFVLGLINFLWGPAILARRDKVAIVNPIFHVFFLSKDTRQRTSENIIALQCECDALSIEVSCELVLTQGERKLEIKEVEVILDEKACKGLERYFHLPYSNRLNLAQTADDEKVQSPFTPSLLSTKQAVLFKGEASFDCTDEFERARDKIGVDSYPEFIQPLLDELKTKYQIRWTRYDGKRLCWRFPDKWWRNLGKKLWG
jgi:hypothetical protein